MELSPDALRGAQFTERFRGYDAAEVDAFLNDAADALDEYIAEQSAPMAALAAERARLAIEDVRRDGLAEVEDLQHRRDELAVAVAGLRRMLEDRRRSIVSELDAIDAALAEAREATDVAGIDGDAAAAGESGSDTFLARLEEVAAEGDGRDGD